MATKTEKILATAIKYATQRKDYGKPNVKRTEIYTVLSWEHGEDAIGNGKMMSVDFMNQVAEAVGGTYTSKGGAKIIFG
jgi:hypothetical protein